MADKKISQLTASTTPLAGTEVLPVVQSGVTKQVSVANLTAGRAVSMLSAALTGSSETLTASGFRLGQGTAFAGGQTEGYTLSTTPLGLGTTGAATLKLYTGSVEAVSIDTSQNVKVTTGNLVIGTAGKGIDFSADPSAAGMTSELLDDYEEGTWTPTDASGAGLTFTTSNTNYTKVGNTVFVTGVVTFPATADASAAQIGGLPFTAKASSNGFFPAVNNASLSIVGNVASGTATFYLAQPETTNNRTNANMSTYLIAFSGTYLAA